MIAGIGETTTMQQGSLGQIETTVGVPPDLYESDETAWLETMAELIEAGRFEALDYPHLGEYLTDMAKRDRREVKNRLVVLLTHLLKWEHQPHKRSRSWSSTIMTQRRKLVDAASTGVLRRHAEAVLDKMFSEALEQAQEESGLPLESFPNECPYTIEQLFSKNFMKQLPRDGMTDD